MSNGTTESTIRPGDIHAVVHTHFDREWYEQRWSYLARLVTQVDWILDEMDRDPKFRATLDGQSILIEDYVSVAPARTTELRDRIATGRLAVGPWWVLADLMLPTGETMLRNLAIGTRKARESGAVSVVGYVPDMFGLPAQTPQVLRLAGLDFALTWRGFGADDPLEHVWEGPDGSSVVTVLLAPLAYAMAADHLDPPASRSLHEVVAEVSVGRPSGQIPLMLGGDHWLPTQSTLDAVRSAGISWDTVDGLRRAVLDRTRGGTLLSTRRGEAYANGHTLVLPGVLSARMPLRRANKLLEHALITTEAFIGALGAAGPSSAGARVDAIWRMWLENTAHDSLCGCSTDAVHEQTAVRVSEAGAGLHALVRETTKALAGTEPLRVDRIWTREFSRSRADHLGTYEFGVFALGDGGRACLDWLYLDHPATAVSVTTVDGLELAARIRPTRSYDDGDVRVYKHQVEIDIPVGTVSPMSVTPLRMTPTLADCPPPAVGSSISNGSVSVFVESDGSLCIETGDGNPTIGPVTLVDIGDRGDSYDFDPVPGDVAVEGLHDVQTTLTHDPLGPSLQVVGSMRIPARLTPDRDGRSPLEVDCPVQLDVLLPNAFPGTVEIQVEIDNRAEDHRVRLRVPTGLATETTHADAAFHVVERPIEHTELDEIASGRIERGVLEGATQPQRPMEGFVAVQDDSHVVVVAADGCSEFAPHHDVRRGTVLELTLLRAFGHLSRYDLRSRRWEAGPPTPTPGGQVQGVQSHRFAITATSGDWVSAEAPAFARRLQRPVIATTPRTFGVFTRRPPPLRVRGATVSALVPDLINRAVRTIHLVNLDPKPTTAVLDELIDVDALTIVDLHDTRLETLEMVGGRGEIPLRPWQVVRVRLEPQEIA